MNGTPPPASGSTSLTERWWWSAAVTIVIGLVVVVYQVPVVLDGRGVWLTYVILALGTAAVAWGLVQLSRAHRVERDSRSHDG